MTPVTSSPAARFRSSPEFAHLALQGSVWSEVWLWSMPVARVIHWEWLCGLSVAGAEFSGGEAALRRRNPPVCAFRQLKGRCGLQELAQKGKRGVLMLTEGRNRLVRPCRADGDDVERRVAGGARRGGR